jgi:hypothetical protein
MNIQLILFKKLFKVYNIVELITIMDNIYFINFIKEEIFLDSTMRNVLLVFACYGAVSFVKDVYNGYFKGKDNNLNKSESKIESDSDSDILIINDISSDSETIDNSSESIIRKRRRTTEN